MEHTRYDRLINFCKRQLYEFFMDAFTKLASVEKFDAFAAEARNELIDKQERHRHGGYNKYE